MTEGREFHPVFMFGFERSGTTLLSMITGSHPELAVPLTVTGMWYLYGMKLTTDYNNLEKQEDLCRLIDDLLNEERIKLWDESFNAEEILEGLPLCSYPAVIDRFHTLYAERKGKPFWGNLDIATLDDMDKMYQWFPKARFIHIVRDGRDVALSHETMPYGAANTFDCAQSWDRRLVINMKMGAIIGSEQYLQIRYEDLVLNTEKTLQNLCEFLGLKYSGKMLNYGNMVAEKIPKDRRWLWPALDKKPQKSKCYTWKSKMDEKRRIVFESEARKMLADLGYEIYSKVPKKTSAYAFQLWCFMGRGGRFKRLASAFGLKQKSQLEQQWSTSNNGR